MKLSSTATPAPAPAVRPRVAPLLGIAAAGLLGWLPLLFARGVQSAFSQAPAAWTYSLGFVLMIATLGFHVGDWVSRRLSPGNARMWHGAIVVIAAALLPVVPALGATGTVAFDATNSLLRLLVRGIGLPAFALGFHLGVQMCSRRDEGSGMYMLVGLLAGQIAFLFVLDPLVATSRIDQAFSWCFLGFTVLLLVGLWQGILPRPEPEASPAPRPSAPVFLIEAGLFAAIAALLLAVTGRSMSDSVSAPRLWVLPCLITLVAFSAGRLRPALHRPGIVVALSGIGALALTATLYLGPRWTMGIQLQVLYAGLAAGVLACAGALGSLAGNTAASARASLGMVLAVPLVTYAAQHLMTDTFEYHLAALFATALPALVIWRRQPASRLRWMATAVVAVLFTALAFNYHGRNLNTVGRVRTFFGVTSTIGVGSGANAYYVMLCGDTPRAAQFLAEDARFEPTMSHARTNGIGRLFGAHPKGNFRRVGVVGIGNGDLVAYAHPSDVFRFYEYDPGAALTAETTFRYLPHANFDWEVVPGDPRRVLDQAPPQGLDLLVLDAFSAGPLPAHLLTSEAFAVWRRHLGPDGVLAVNVTNTRFDLLPVVWRLAIEQGLAVAPALSASNPATGQPSAEWLFLSPNSELLRRTGFPVAGPKETEEARRFPLWTDARLHPLSVLK